MSGIEQFQRVHTRILTQGTAGTADPPLPPAPVLATPIFIMASFRTWDVENPASPSQVGLVTSPNVGFGKAVVKDGTTVWCADVNRNFSSVSVATPTAPVVLDQLLTISLGGNQGLVVDGTNIYLIGGGNGGAINFLNVINGSDPSDLSITITYNLQTGFAVSQRFPRAIVGYVTTHRLYIVSAESGQNTVFAVYDATTPAAVTQQGTLNLTMAPAFSQVCDLAINFPLAYALLAGNGSSIAAVLKIIDVTDPAAPVVLSTTTIGGVTDNMKKLSISGTTLYIGGASQILTYNVSNSAAPTLNATLTLTGIDRPLTSMFIRSASGIAYVGSAGDGESSAKFSIWDLSTGLQFQDGFSPSATSGIALTGAAI